MAVQAATLDILTDRAHLDPQVARAIGDAIALEMGTAREPLATKQDIAELRQESKADMAVLRQDLKADMAALRQEIKIDVATLRHETNVGMAELKGLLEAKIEGSKADIVRWVFTAVIGQMAVTLGAVYFMMRALH
jgi:hypothetical protein